MENKTCYVIVGATAVGKTSAALQLAKHFNTQIISADSRQCFKELNIGVAKPSPAELKSVHHYFINSHSIHDEVNARLFEDYALRAINNIFLQNDYAVMIGGTGLYVKAFCEGMDTLPETDPIIRKKILEDYEKFGIEWLQHEVKKNDPDFFLKGEIYNPRRLMRALEIIYSTGKSILEFQSHQKKKRNFKIIKTGLELPKETLYKNINERVDFMIENGLIEEAEKLKSSQHLNALQTVGYKELFDFFENKTSLAEAIHKIKLNTRHYAKRQMTWFKKDKEINWLEPNENLLSKLSIE